MSLPRAAGPGPGPGPAGGAPDLPRLLEAQEATWPPAAKSRAGGFVIRAGAGGGKRVSAATWAASATPTSEEIAQAEAAMAALGQPPLFMLRPDERPLAAALAARGYDTIEESRVLVGPLAPLAARRPPPLVAYPLWEPLEILRTLWAEGGIGPARQAVMARVAGPKTALLGRAGDRVAGAAFMALAGDLAFCHALYVAPAGRRGQLATHMLCEAAHWAQGQGAHTLVVLVTAANAPARALYASLELSDVGYYTYMAKSAATGESG